MSLDTSFQAYIEAGGDRKKGFPEWIRAQYETQLEAAKQREREWNDANVEILLERDNWMHKFDARQAELLQLTQEREAALSALEKIVSTYHSEEKLISQVAFDMAALAKQSLAGNPSAALAERDRAIVERCLELITEAETRGEAFMLIQHRFKIK